MEEKDTTKYSLNCYLDFLERNYFGREIRTGVSVPRFPPELWSQIDNCLEGRQMIVRLYKCPLHLFRRTLQLLHQVLQPPYFQAVALPTPC